MSARFSATHSMTSSLVTFAIVHVASIVIVLAFVVMETVRPDKERQSSRKALRRTRTARRPSRSSTIKPRMQAQ